MSVYEIAIFLAVWWYAPTSPEPRITALEVRLALEGVPTAVTASFFNDTRLYRYPGRAPIRREWTWQRFTTELLEPRSIVAGERFFLEHWRWFLDAQLRYGVSPEDILAILRIETRFGNELGSTGVFNVFYTYLFDRKESRALWAQDNLSALIHYCLAARLDCFELKGSHMGAFGLPQFLPVSALAYGVDADGNGVVDLFSVPDAISSAANYLAERGYHTDRLASFADYYGSSYGYPRAVHRYASALSIPSP